MQDKWFEVFLICLHFILEWLAFLPIFGAPPLSQQATQEQRETRTEMK